MKMREKTLQKALLRSSTAPSGEQMARLTDFVRRKYGQDYTLEWQADPAMEYGFQLIVGGDIYDWTAEGRLRQLREELEEVKADSADSSRFIPLMRETVERWNPQVEPEEIGEVITVGDEIATVRGLEHAEYGEILIFASGVKGMVQDLRRDEVGCIIFGDDSEIAQGSYVRRTGKTAGTPVGEGFLGRVVDALGAPIDGLGDIQAEGYRPIENPAPGIIQRQSVDTPMETGLLAIDSMFPIGRGQRELIIGDRQTGKTAIALDTILNQKGKNVVCIYVAIGQKASSVARLAETLRQRGGHGLYHHRQRLRQCIRLSPVYRPLRRVRPGRVFHVPGQGRAHRL